MISTFTIEGNTREEIKAKLQKRPDYGDAFSLGAQEMKTSGLFGLFRKKKYVESFVIREMSHNKKKKMDQAYTTLQTKVIQNKYEATRVRPRPAEGRDEMIRNLGEIKRAISLLENRDELSEDLARECSAAAPETEKSGADLPQDSDVLDRLLKKNRFLEDVRADMIKKVHEGSPGIDWNDKSALRFCLKNILAENIMFEGVLDPGDPKVKRIILLAGPTGVGKTTTLVKLSTSFFRQKRKLRYLTFDTYKIGAAEQLKSFARILDVPIEVARSPEELRQKAQDAQEEIVFIDTSGRSQKDGGKIRELRSLVGLFDRKELQVLLLANSSTNEEDLEDIISRFSVLEPDSLVLTKMDETSSCGRFLSVLYGKKIPFSYVTTGQDVPENIEIANTDLFLNKILGQE